MNCPKCKSEQIRALVNVVMYIDANYAYAITKKVISNKETTLWAVDHDKTSFVCMECLNAWGGRLKDNYDTTTSKIPNEIKESIRRSSRHRKIASKENERIRAWLFKNDLLNDANIDQLIDSTEISDEPENFIMYLEDDPVTGNSEDYDF